jgi:DNA topoisomerase-1
MARSSSPVLGAKIARLQETGFLRRNGGRGPSAYATRSRSRPDAAELERIRRLRVPPAWTDVAISRSASSPLQAVGRDRAGRWQYLYTPAHVERREARKRARLAAFLRALPQLRTSINRGLRAPGLSRERVMSAILRILSVGFLRPGSAAYAAQNGSFGLATLRPRHVSVHGPRISFDFRGKAGKRQRHELVDRQVASIVRSLLRVPAPEVFKYRSEDGAFKDVRRRDINLYIREVTGRPFTAKDFRIWAATILCAAALADGTDCAPSQRRRRVASSIRSVAAALGNTPAVCRASYINPRLLRAFESGSLPERLEPVDLPAVARRPRLCEAETTVLRLLENRRVPLPRAARAHSEPRPRKKDRAA